MLTHATVDLYAEKLADRLARIRNEFDSDCDRIAQDIRSNVAVAPRARAHEYIVSARAFVKRGAEAAFGEEERIKRAPFVNDDEATTTTDSTLREFVDQVGIIMAERINAMMPKSPADADRFLANAHLDVMLDHCIRMARAGLLHDAEPVRIPSTPTVNSVTIGTAIGTAVQQGSPGASISLENHLDLQVIARAADALERELAVVSVPSRAADDLKADVASIKAQLSKPKPEPGLLKGLAQSMRNVTEGAIGGALSPAIIQAAGALIAALGG